MDETEPMPPAPKNGASATEADEEKVLRELYGEPDADGFFHASDAG
ncbi:hypothetical protein [Actinomadura sp. KC06]|nr:hypothetical protein [Actinomadura sp. KC06]